MYLNERLQDQHKMINANFITKGLGENQSIVLRGFGGILHWIKKLISNALIKIKIGRKAHIFPLEKERRHIHPTDGRKH